MIRCSQWTVTVSVNLVKATKIIFRRFFFQSICWFWRGLYFSFLAIELDFTNRYLGGWMTNNLYNKINLISEKLKAKSLATNFPLSEIKLTTTANKYDFSHLAVVWDKYGDSGPWLETMNQTKQRWSKKTSYCNALNYSRSCIYPFSFSIFSTGGPPNEAASMCNMKLFLIENGVRWYSHTRTRDGAFINYPPPKQNSVLIWRIYFILCDTFLLGDIVAMINIQCDLMVIHLPLHE